MDTLQGVPSGVNGRHVLTAEQEAALATLSGPSQAVSDMLAKAIGYPPENAPKKRRTVASLYAPLDVHKATTEVWPDVVPPLTDIEATRAARRLYQRFYLDSLYKDRGRKQPRKGSEYPVRVTSGRRYNWVRNGVLVVNPSGGWRKLVHDFSHYIHAKQRPSDRPHSDNHRHLEKEMIVYVIEHGWLDGKLRSAPKVEKTSRPSKPEKPKLTVRERNEAKVIEDLSRWLAKAKKAEADLKRAKKKLTVLKAKKRYYDRNIVFTL